MVHADTPTLLRNQMAGGSAAQVGIYLRLTERLRDAGACSVSVTSIAGHFCIEAFKAVSPLPVIDMLVEVDGALAAQGLRKVGILGTRLAMQSRFYGAARSTVVVPPDGGTLDAVHDAYIAMAASGTVTAAQRAVFFNAGRALVDDHGVEAVMLGGTDLALAFAGQDPGFAVFDCAGVHADAIAEFAAA